MLKILDLLEGVHVLLVVKKVVVSEPGDDVWRRGRGAGGVG